MKSTDPLRLLVATDSAYRNHVPNPDGALGTWGWETPGTGATLSVNANGLYYQGTPLGPPVLGTETILVAPGEYVRAAATCVTTTGAATLAIIWRDSAGLATGATVTATLTAGQRARTAVAQAPAGAAGYTVAIQTTADATFTSVTAIHAPTSVELTTGRLDAPDPTLWTDTFGAAASITVARRPLDLGTMTITVRHTRGDTRAQLLKAGRRIRLALDTGAILSTGTIAHIDTTYPRRPTGRAPHTITTLTVADPATILASRKQSRAVATIDQLRVILENCGIPWRVNGSTTQTSAPTTLGADTATVIDQIAITRDSNLGYAWVSRDGILNVNDPAHMSTTAVRTLTEADYSGIEIGWTTDGCITAVTIACLTPVTDPQTNETTLEVVNYGPYLNPAGIDAWGYHPATYTLNIAPEAVQSWAEELLAANSAPHLIARNITIPIRHRGDLPNATLDLYDLVRVTNTDADLDVTLRITSIDHNITPNRWTITLGFDVDGYAAPPQRVPLP